MNRLLDNRLGVSIPIIQAPMGGGPNGPELAAAVSNAGALGSLPGAYLTDIEFEKDIRRTRELTDRPFCVNLFIPTPTETWQTLEESALETAFHAALDATRPYRQELGLPDPKIAPPYEQDFEKQISVILREKPAAFSFIFGLLPKKVLDECRRSGILTIGTATTLEEGLALQKSGVDAVIAQGLEAGGHHGIFSQESDDPDIDTLTLTKLLAKNLSIPVIAAGGIMAGVEIKAALDCGAQAVQMGTAFLLCDEAKTTAAYRKALTGHGSTGTSGRNKTALTRAFSGRLARGLENRFMKEMVDKKDAILPFPIQNSFTRDIRKKAAEAGRAEFLSLWAGTGVEKIRQMKAGELVKMLYDELLNL